MIGINASTPGVMFGGVREMEATELLAGAGGCTELTCIYHQEFVAGIRRRLTSA